MGSIASNANVAPSTPSIVHIAVQLGLGAFLVYVCARIISPFLAILLWSAILAVMFYPLHLFLSVRLGNRWSAFLIGMVGVGIVLVPMFVLVTSLGSTIYSLVSGLQNRSLIIPLPPTWLVDLPVVGAKLSDGWSLAAANLPLALSEYGQILTKPAAWLASFAGGLTTGGLSFLLSIVIAAVLVAYAKGAAAFALSLMELFTNSRARGARLVKLTAATIRGVAVGVVGVAVIQSILVGVAFFAIGLSAAGALTLVTFLLALVQVPALLVTLPVMAYVFATEATTPAIIFAVWSFVAGLSDNFLKPLMLGRGSDVPMPVILVGVIGGILADGLLGIFVGPVLLAVGFVLLMEWMNEGRDEDEAQIEGQAL